MAVLAAPEGWCVVMRFSWRATVLLVVSVATCTVVRGDVTLPVDIDFAYIAARTSEEFLSVTIDAGEIAHNFSGLDLNSEKMINIGKALAPAAFRFGGTAEDYLTYSISPGDVNVSPASSNAASADLGMDRLYAGASANMTREQWDLLNMYVETIGMTLIFGLNAQKRTEDGSWDMTNAKRLIEYTRDKGYRVNYELGNEPDLYPEHADEKNISGRQMAEDFHTLSTFLKSSGSYKILAGPDVATLTGGSFFENFLDSVERGEGPNVITWHQYYGDGRKFKLADFHSASVLDKLHAELDKVKEMLQKTAMADADVWLGETSSCYGGGAPGISDTFIAGFMWLDKLGMAALYNYTHICRQTLWGGSYSLIDSHTGNPLPDFYASLAYKQLMGERVLSVEGQLRRGRTTRVYAHCTRILPGSEFQPGFVTIMAMNLDSTTSTQMRLASRFDHTVVAQYLFQPTDKTPTCKSVTLNRNLLPMQLINDKQVPTLRPQRVVIPTNGTIQVPAMSYAFFVIPANATACM